MEEHLRDRHPKWELTKSRVDRENFSAMFGSSELKRRNLDAVEVLQLPPEQSEGSSDASVVENRGQKYPSQSPAGTPRCHRVLKISRPAADGSRVVTLFKHYF
ncbi:hypothetical protein B0H17DRAFT_1132029 [Mycena rosella]|uniref:Uncharacterized protein n=1 Tax=Mycena rosella TaxID=1033263 RepID=A0AAD7DLU7_MYCRO|nr:hypothetical protein B0H17DRAFT_1132029 [Mycena rosella]